MQDDLLKKVGKKCSRCKDIFYNTVDLVAIEDRGTCSFCRDTRETNHLEVVPPEPFFTNKTTKMTIIGKILAIPPLTKRLDEDYNNFSKRIKTFNDTIKLVLKVINE